MPQTDWPSWAKQKLIDAGSIPAGETGMTTPISTEMLEEKTIYVKADTNTKVYVLTGPTADECNYRLKSGTGVDTEDADREWDCDNEAISFAINEFTNFISVVIVNEDSSNAATVSVDLA